MLAYSVRDIRSIYDQLIKSAQKGINKKKYQEAIIDLETAAFWAYSFNCFYTDENADQLLKLIALRLYPDSLLINGLSNKCVLIDSYCHDNRGLTQQYLRAMISNGMDILYICTAANTEKGKDIINELDTYHKARILHCGFGDPSERIIRIKKAINEFGPKHIFLHVKPWDATAIIACLNINGCFIYNINLTDHAYWLGASLIDYNIEFRPYGMTVSYEKRRLSLNKLLFLPYYPVTPICTGFKGLPELPEKAVVFLTGGLLYKMLGKDDIFFQIMDRILDIAPYVYIYVAGFAPSFLFDDKCSKMKNHDRVFQIGVRTDIDAVFDHCDIYLSTYPMIGGLMTQYAAKHGKPVVAYHEEGDVMNYTEEILNNFQDEYKSFSSLEEMVEYATKLVIDESFRICQGRIIQEGLMDKAKFDDTFKIITETHKNIFNWGLDRIDYPSFTERYLELENTNGFLATKQLVIWQRTSLIKKVRGYNRFICLAVLNAMKKNILNYFRR